MNTVISQLLVFAAPHPSGPHTTCFSLSTISVTLIFSLQQHNKVTIKNPSLVQLRIMHTVILQLVIRSTAHNLGFDGRNGFAVERCTKSTGRNDVDVRLKTKGEHEYGKKGKGTQMITDA